MKVYKAPNADGTVITVTSTATLIYDLINTAASATDENAGYPAGMNAIDILVESEDIRVLFDGNTPTTSKGLLLKAGGNYSFRNIPIDKLMLIRDGSVNATVGVQIGKSVEGESDNLGGGGGGSSSSSASGATSPDVGSSTYFAKPSGLNADAVSAYAAATQITVTGLPYTFTKYDIERIDQVPTSGNVTSYTDKADFSVSGTTITVTGATFGATDSFVVTLSGPPRTEDTPASAEQTLRLNPDSESYVGETLAALSNIAANTTGYLYLDMAGYKYFTMQCDTSGTTPTDTLTLTVEATLQDDGTAAASCAYVDVTNDWFGVASVVDADVNFAKDTPTAAKYVRLKYVTSNTGGSDADLTVYAKRLY